MGERGMRGLTDTSASTLDGLVEAIVDRYFAIDCAIFTPNPSRLDHIAELARSHRANGVIHYSLQFCTPYQMESGPVERALEKLGVPVLRIDTDYSQEDVEPIRTRVEAFLERIR